MNWSIGSLISYFFPNLISILFTIPVLLVALPLHEMAHAAVAYALGDQTAKDAGRLTPNPLRHLDPLGTICLILFGFGWAKPTPVNPYNFRNRREGMALTAVAGPLMNLLLAFISLFLLRFTGGLVLPSLIKTILLYLLEMSAQINIGLFIFNLIPIVPLDGSRILMLFLPGKAEAFFYRYEGALQFVLLGLLFFGVLTRPLTAAVTNIYNNLYAFVRMI